MRRAAQVYSEATRSNNRAGRNEVLAAQLSFLTTARRLCASDIPGIRATLLYDYFQRRASDEQAVRDELGKLYDTIFSRLQSSLKTGR